MNRRRATIVVLAAASLSLFLRWAFRAPSESEPLDSTWAESHESASIDFESSRDDHPTTATARALVVAVVDSAGNPVSEVKVIQRGNLVGAWRSNDRDASVVGKTDRNGTVRIHGVNGKSSFAFLREGYAPVVRVAQANQSEMRVLLHRGYEKRLRFALPGGDSVEGVRVQLFRADVSYDDAFDGEPLGHQLRSRAAGGCTFEGISGEDGIVVIRDVPSGAYSARVSSQGAFVADKVELIRRPIRVPGPIREILMVRPRAAVVRIVGDVVVAKNPILRASRGAQVHNLRREVAHATERLLQRFPDCDVRVAATVPGFRGKPSLQLSLFWRGSGWHSYEIELLPIASISSPVTIVAPAFEATRSASIKIELDDGSDNRAASLRSMRLTYGVGLKRFAEIIEIGKPVEVPPGKVQVRPAGLLFPRSAFGAQEVQLVAGETTVVRWHLPEQSWSQKFRVLLPDGSPTGNVALLLRTSAGETLLADLESEADIVFGVPSCDYVLRVLGWNPIAGVIARNQQSEHRVRLPGMAR